MDSNTEIINLVGKTFTKLEAYRNAKGELKPWNYEVYYQTGMHEGIPEPKIVWLKAKGKAPQGVPLQICEPTVQLLVGYAPIKTQDLEPKRSKLEKPE